MQKPPMFLSQITEGMNNPISQLGLGLLAGSMSGDPGRGLAIGSRMAGRASENMARRNERQQLQAQETQKKKLFLEALTNSGADPKTIPLYEALGPKEGSKLLLKRLLEKPEAASTDDIREYNFAKQNGFQGSFMDYLDRNQRQQPGKETPQTRAEYARSYGLEPGSDAFQRYVLTGDLPEGVDGFKDKKQALDAERDYRKEFTSLTKDFRSISDAYSKVETASQNPSAAGDLALVFNFMKMLDPGSVVREGEFATAEQAAGVPQRVVNLYNRLLSGERLAPEQRTDFASQAKNVLASQQGAYRRMLEQYRSIAEGAGLEVDRAVPDFYPLPKEDEPPPAKAGAGSAPKFRARNPQTGEVIVSDDGQNWRAP